MLIALDYDDTFTRDPAAWISFIELMNSHGHVVVCATMRNASQGVPGMPEHVAVIYTFSQAKKPYLRNMGIRPDIWIDDRPEWILQNAASHSGRPAYSDAR